MTNTVGERFPLGLHWPTVDPFLFCAHHHDAYPASDGAFGPRAALTGREIGADFAGIDGWNMYHGRHVPGFPAHPHRGFETVTYVRRGLIDHADSLGATARFRSGDTQWLTAGRGIVHSEMFPLLDPEAPNPLELFQIWLNLPADDKMTEPHFAMLWAEELPVHRHTGVEIVTVAGALDGIAPPAPPPHSWASRPDTDVAIWHIRLATGAEWTLPAAAGPRTQRMLYAFDGAGLAVEGERLGASTGAPVVANRPLRLAAPDGAAEALLLQGRPIGEPVAQYGPFVLNDRAGIVQAFDDFERTQFGGWPWPSEAPHHGDERGRFARHADGRVETRAASS
jgi:quercetin 2,3-dioxygenase